ncbi:sulfatase-like hydrolase/transferase [Halogeometricum limi]|uniref:Sulfatase n=1 Tax=Halogeometricum limi TaxID=555875 RepID=A0A1I6GGQ0_9EURY|nr:sulfatase-like hydrolase/transferase [Halogeometricum limi]SFR41349.1 Sulfatase [Halogeometricum limi]
MRNVVLLCLDSVRMDTFQEFATRLQDRADVEYTQCRAASSWSPPSHASMFTGELPHEHGVHAFNPDFSHLSREDTFLGDLSEHRLVGTSANVYASSAYGFDGLFDEFVDVSPHRRFPNGLDVVQFGSESDERGLSKYAAFVRAALEHDHTLESLANGAVVQLEDISAKLPFPKPTDDGASIVAKNVERLADHDDRPFFLFANFMDAHLPHTPVWGYDQSLHDVPARWHSDRLDDAAINIRGEAAEYPDDIENFRQLYDASVEYLDRKVSALIGRIEEATTRETTFVVTADHGENLAYQREDGLIGHNASLSEALLHVPLLIINAPASSTAVVDDYVSHLDLGELIVGLTSGTAPDIGRSRVFAERIGSTTSNDHSEKVRRRLTRTIRAVYEGRDKFLWDSTGFSGRYELDPDRPSWERLADDGIDVAEFDASFSVPLEDARETGLASQSRGETNTATKQRLEDLGYL